MADRKIVIYTSLTGGYDNLPQYEIIDPDFDYICFSNDYPEDTKIGQWTIKSIPYLDNNPIHLSRFVKLLPHLVLSNYEWSVWLDANLRIVDNIIYSTIKEIIANGNKWNGINHPQFDCLYDDALECLYQAKAKYNDVFPLIEFLKKEGFPSHWGLMENNLIIRNNNDLEIQKICHEWWNLFIKYCPRDQLSLFYVFWKHNFKPSLIFPKEYNTHNIKGIEFKNHPHPNTIVRLKRKIIAWNNRVKLAKQPIIDIL